MVGGVGARSAFNNVMPRGPSVHVDFIIGHLRTVSVGPRPELDIRANVTRLTHMRIWRS